MSTNPSNTKVLPLEAFYGKREITTVLCVADSSKSLQNTYIVFYTIDEDGTATKYAAWINVNSEGAEPTVAGATMIEVAIATDALASAVATALDSALSAATDCVSSVSDATVTITNKYFGDVTAAADTGLTGFTVTVTTAGWGGSLGGTEDVEVAPEFSTVPVNFSQWGETDLDQILIGQKCMVSFRALEITDAFWENVVNKVFGEAYTDGGADLLGFGTSKLFGPLMQYAGELILKPVNRTDDTGNLTFWKALPTPGAMGHSGTELHGIDLEFVAAMDSTKNSKINVWFRGDEIDLL